MQVVRGNGQMHAYKHERKVQLLRATGITGPGSTAVPTFNHLTHARMGAGAEYMSRPTPPTPPHPTQSPRHPHGAVDKLELLQNVWQLMHKY